MGTDEDDEPVASGVYFVVLDSREPPALKKVVLLC